MARLVLHGLICVLGCLCGLTNAQESKQGSGKTAPIGAVAFHPDGKRIVIGGKDTLTLLEGATHRPLRRLPHRIGMVTALAFRPDGRILVAAGGQPGQKGVLTLWDVATGTLLQRLEAHADVIYGLAFSPDGRRLVTGSYDRTVQIWHTQTAVSTRLAPTPQVLRDHTDAVYAVAFSPDGKRVASAAGDRTVKVWDVATGRRLYTLSDSTAELYALAFRPDGTQLAAGGVDKTLRVWNLSAQGGSLARAAFAHDAALLRIAYSPDGSNLLTAGEDRRVKRWDATTLAERQVYPLQPDWPQALALSPDNRWLALGRADGSFSLLPSGVSLKDSPVRRPASPSKSTPTLANASLPARPPYTPERVTPKSGGATLFEASLESLRPYGAQRGQTVRFTLKGSRLEGAEGLYFDDPAITGKWVTPAEKSPNTLQAEVMIGPNARVGVHSVRVRTPHGTTGSLPFAVGEFPEQTLTNNPFLSLPMTVVGAIAKPGEVGSFRLSLNAGDEVVFEVVAASVRSRLQPVVSLLDVAGKVLTEQRPSPKQPDLRFGYRFPTAGTYTVQIRDGAGASGGDVAYRLTAGRFPYITQVFPLGLQRDTTTEAQVEGFNLGGRKTLRLRASSQTGIVPLTTLLGESGLSAQTRSELRLAVGEDPEVVRVAGNSSQTVALPVTINGRLTRGVQEFRFAAKKGQRWGVDVLARRLGSLLDSQLEIRDAQGRPIERAVIRAVGQTEVTLSDRDSASGGFRLVAWNDFYPNDYLMAGREVVRILRLPNGPDEDVIFRTYRGQRLGYFGTTPEYHSVGAMVYKVEVHPPGSRFSSNGMPLTPLYYQNDDGGPLLGKDSWLEFTAPADGEYLLRLTDARGQYGENYPYRLNIRPLRPDFRVSFSPAHPNIPQGGGVVLSVECERYDGFDGPIALALEGLPAGFTAPPTAIEAGETSASFLLSASPQAPRFAAPEQAFRLVAKAQIAGLERVHAVEPENGRRLLTVLASPDIQVTTDRQAVTIRPGQEAVVRVKVARQGDFGRRVPIDVRNLPYGVRVLDVGLNGVLVTEEEASRQFVLYCEPWVLPQTRPFYVLAAIEGGIANAALPLTLRVEK